MEIERGEGVKEAEREQERKRESQRKAENKNRWQIEMRREGGN